MKKTLLGIIFFLLLYVYSGYCADKSLQLIIESDRQVYVEGESVSITSRLSNVSKDTLKIAKPSKTTVVKVYFNNEYGQKYVLSYIDTSNRAMSSELRVGESAYVTGVTFSLPNEAMELAKYKVLGKQSIYMVDRGFTSNTITIRVVNK